ncbi:aminotransferase class IV family protein [Pararhizobium gei]|uniref:aminotransferase class IV family protein n=1 Tax=Pararhizobium gei TaxID=1395951 RepID=UPI0023D9BFF7|nr:aminotransferase class IV family protein [Rhizobium gei]
MSDFQLIETMRWEPGAGIVRLALHMARLKRSAGRLGFLGAEKAEDHLAEAIAEALPPSVPSGHLPHKGGDYSSLQQAQGATSNEIASPAISPLVGEMPDRADGGKALHATGTSSLFPLRVRLTLDSAGEIDITTTPFTPLPTDTIWTVRLAKTRLSSADPLLRHKTSRRAVYEAARAEYSGNEAQEVLLLNEHGAPCEGTITSIFLDDGSGILKTPPIACGLLAGVLRTEMICARRARVERFSLGDLRKGKLYMGNSLRGLIACEILSA